MSDLEWVAARCEAEDAPVTAAVLRRQDYGATAMEAVADEVSTSRFTADEAVFVIELLTELGGGAWGVDEAIGLWREGCVACALMQLGTPGRCRCDEHTERSV